MKLWLLGTHWVQHALDVWVPYCTKKGKDCRYGIVSMYIGTRTGPAVATVFERGDCIDELAEKANHLPSNVSLVNCSLSETLIGSLIHMYQTVYYLLTAFSTFKIDSNQFEKILKYIKSGVDSGATLESGGERYDTKGFYDSPTVFSNVQYDMLIAKDEIIRPVQSVLKLKDINEVIQRANNSPYGLATGCLLAISTLPTLTRALRIGTVWVNCFYVFVFDATTLFGGFKVSGHGREKGIYGLSNNLQVKVVVTPLKNPTWFIFRH